MVQIAKVAPGSPADRKHLLPGDYLISINGHEIRDVLDYRYYLAERSVKLLIHRGPDLLEVSIRKEEYDDIGLDFSTFLMDTQKSCRNKCIFCFIDQLPDGMRDSLYFKDDDSRMSFLMGSYVTLTNLKEEDVDRILAMHMSPIRISVHTTDPELRVSMMKNPRAGEVLSYLRRFADAHITMECQIVLCKGYNDGMALERTLTDLEAYLPSLNSCSIVPCGLTCHREKLPKIEPFSPEDCLSILDQVSAHQEHCISTTGKPVFYCSDEFYLKSGRPFPEPSFYCGFPQIENGVGMIPSMREELEEELRLLPDECYAIRRTVSVATGEAAYPFLKQQCARLSERIPGLSIFVYPIRNDFFGEEITVAGLVTGGDLIRQLREKELGETLCIPSVMLRYEGDLFLDDVSLPEAEEALGVPITVSEAGSGRSFLSAVLGISL
ncbi:MAG: DUF512 domain-containing protein [Candidatus Methanomethylophilaceae archaeon]|nr:DUF512 domain-containing protein [Candidatus Methanomethylophilaceae archaeon]